ncbi:sirohydrochlorin cobaltochelatase [Desulfovibrio mangrovi]|uniref:sirohydrochlorin cobaltochelatase n=1 Tax=Desulfovibrio mangrovi TaxID=2976983 RepID=UPI002245802A|nr:sirohydrochlorin cobaltochelatase [Desulfovibrio mangrovi]UZP67139.1 sirohydrochlorin cobaltochelatase [Desulfovibrio mangrovi]
MFLSRLTRWSTTLLLLLVLALPAFAGHGKNGAEREGILLVAFGTTVPEARAAFDNIEEEVRKAFPDTEIRWAYSAKQVRRTIKENEGTALLSPASALARMGDEGFTHVAVQSLHTIPGAEFHDLIRTVAAFRNMPKGTRTVTLGEALLSSPDDMEKAAKALVSTFPAERKKTDAVVLMGHGTHHPANIYYPGLQYYLSKVEPNAFVGTVEGAPSLEDVVNELKARKARTVWLMPLMAVAGDHARNDMAGPEPESWKSVLEKEGFTVHTILRGTGEFDAITAIWVDHLRDAFSRLNQ